MTGPESPEPKTWAGRPVARRCADARPRARAVVTGTIVSAQETKTGPGVSFYCVLADDTGQIGLLFLGRRSVAGCVPGARCTAEGTARRDGRGLTLWNPLFTIESDDSG